LHAAVLRWRVWVHRQVEEHPLWRAMRRQILQWRADMAAGSGRANRWTRRLRAARRLDRMRMRRRPTAPIAG